MMTKIQNHLAKVRLMKQMIKNLLYFLLISVTLQIPLAFAQLSPEGGELQVKAQSTVLKEKLREVVLSGDVDIVQDDSRLGASSVVFKYGGAGNSKISNGIGSNFENLVSIRADGEVYYVTPDIKVRADSGEYLTETDIITLKGDVVIAYGDDIATGCELEIRIGDGQSWLNGCQERVKMLITPNSDEE